MIPASPAIANLDTALRAAMINRPAAQSFPHLAESLRRAGVHTMTWWLPAMQSCYETDLGPVVVQETPLLAGMADVPAFDPTALLAALRADQAGQSAFPEFAAAAWRAGVVRWVVTLNERTCTYFGRDAQTYVEQYAPVEAGDPTLR